MTPAERTFFRSVAERDPPAQRVKEARFIVGRGGGKDSVASLIAGYSASLFEPLSLRGGERALVACLLSRALIQTRRPTARSSRA